MEAIRPVRRVVSSEKTPRKKEPGSMSPTFSTTIPPSMQRKPSSEFGGLQTSTSTPLSVRASSYSAKDLEASPLSSGLNKRQTFTPTRLPATRGTVVLHPMQAEPDDYLHIPEKNVDTHSIRPTWRGCFNVTTLLIIALCLIMLFAGYPIIANFDDSYNKIDQRLAQGQAKPIPARPPVDPDTPSQYHTRQGDDGTTWELVFSDEFEKEGRTFWPGDDPYWEGGDFYYRATFDYEWYTPEAINTTNGRLQITMDEILEHNTYFRSGMLQSWNKMCFQGGYIEASVVLPGGPQTQGYWPGFWMMGNLGRPGYLATTDGMWPYVYENCDVGILPNQTYLDESGPEAALNAKVDGKTDQLSILTGMRFPACTCSGQGHPGPNPNVARGVPELDIFEIQVDAKKGASVASQSYQVAPFDANYKWYSNQSSYQIYDTDVTSRNPWSGSQTQEALSCVTEIPNKAFMKTTRTPTVFGIEYDPDLEDTGNGYITWYVDGKKSWTVYEGALDANEATKIGKRTFPKEPMSIIINLGIAGGFQEVHWDEIDFPAQMEFDYIRVYQKPGQKRVSCDPSDHPTANYINSNMEMYFNNNLTSFSNISSSWPKNKLTGC
ncbi:kre6-glucan synthase subunit [Malassezia pachydermatis]|uniref:Kre6-glucan synthase subunit n=1 Tax=Malassezia pachydermatis TaxID=77020 RepID=A0A0M8MW13_9BASI|nr:kre6-glucan synthase subunit [Malassezia pachydermatis]KOS14920.1 kre6-glucan synthase subunit [Malassezia pachydermatis]